MPANTTTKQPTPTAPENGDKRVTPRRRYESAIRQQQSAETQERIIAAGAELVHQLPDWDWTNITARAVGERAGVSERTVHRYFPTERQLRDAVIQRMVEEVGVSLDELNLAEFANVTKTMFSYLMSFAALPNTTPVSDPSLATIDQVRRDALLKAVSQAVPPGWSDRDKENATAVLDIFWNLPPYQRLIQVWGFDAKRAVGTMTWLISLVEEAIQQGRRPNIET